MFIGNLYIDSSLIGALIGVIGTLLGAVVAGIITLKISKNQLEVGRKSSQDNIKQEWLNQTIKYYSEFIQLGIDTAKLIPLYSKYIELDRHSLDGLELGHVKRVESCISRLDFLKQLLIMRIIEDNGANSYLKETINQYFKSILAGTEVSDELMTNIENEMNTYVVTEWSYILGKPVKQG